MYSWWDAENNCNIVYLALPPGIDGFISPNEDGTYTILISTDICEERQRRAYEHELSHLRNDDLYAPSADDAERRCHNEVA